MARELTLAESRVVRRPAHDLRLVDLAKDYGSFRAVRGIDLHVPAGRMVSLIGPSGCGKTTTLRMIAGLEVPTRGTISSGGEIFSEGGKMTPPERRDMGMVFQTYALWPHLTVAQNIGYGLGRKRLPRPEIAARVANVLSLVDMERHGERYPNQLSGGQQQRVALARAVAAEPRTLLFDEPLSNLDAVLREQMRFEIRSLQQRLGITAVYVTHSQEEALALSDTIAVMLDGQIVQSGTPTDIYHRPRTEFVATFIGLANILSLHSVERDGRLLRGVLRSGDVILAASGAVEGTSDRKPVKLSVRPVDIRVVSATVPESPGPNRLAGTIRLTVFTGGLVDYFVELESDPETVLRVQSTPPATAAQGDRVVLVFEPARAVALEN